METACLRDEARKKHVEVATTNGITEVSKHYLSLTFGLIEDSITLHQIVGAETNDLSFEMPTIKRGDENVFQLDTQFGRTFVVNGHKMPSKSSTDDLLVDMQASTNDLLVDAKPLINIKASDTMSVIEMLKILPAKNSLRITFDQIREIRQVEELPTRYDGNIMFELPFSGASNRMVGLENKFDGHVWTDEMTSNVSCFMGTVRIRRCGGYLECSNVICDGLQRSGENNKQHWIGRLTKVCPAGRNVESYGTLKCFYCSTPPTCRAECPCKLVMCFPSEQIGKKVTRAVLHIGSHMHPVASGITRMALDEVKVKLKKMVQQDFLGRPKAMQHKLAKEILVESGIFGDGTIGKKLSDKDLGEILEKLAPVLDKRRLSRWRKESQVEVGQAVGEMEAILKLKNSLLFDYFQSVVFLGQLEFSSFNRCHVFKMSSQGPGSGVDLVNKMRPGGDLENCWICFDFVKRMRDWTTMACHVYNPFVQEMQTIAIGDFKVEDTDAQILFWQLLNRVMEREGYEKAKFKGFMADEAQANWRAVRTVFNGGPDNVMQGMERSCSFHWEQSLCQHAKKCVQPHSQEEFKLRCRSWKISPSEEAAEIELDGLRSWLRKGHTDKTNISVLETWIVWWHARVAHWGEYMMQAMEGRDNYLVPRTNLAESVHGSWLASHDGVKYVSLYTASYNDLMATLIQSARYDSFLRGAHRGTGPGIEKIKKRRASTSSITPTPKTIIDLTNEAATELHATKSRSSPDVGVQTVRRKRRGGSETPIQPNDSHRPEYEYVTQNVRRQPQRHQFASMESTYMEVRIHPTKWAIRRTNPGSEVRCQGYLRDKGSKCDALIDMKGRGGLIGVPAPCFEGLISLPSCVKKQYVWFCGNNVDHTWEPADIVTEKPPNRPQEWPVAEGTCLNSVEVQALCDAGFDLQHIGPARGRPAQEGTPQENELDIRPTHRGGKTLVVSRTVTKEMEGRIKRAIELVCTIHSRVVVVNKEHVDYTISTPRSQENGETYKVTISTFPSCTCVDFKIRVDQGKKYMPCKHLYYIYTKELGLDVCQQKYVHQAALTKRELHYMLRFVN